MAEISKITLPSGTTYDLKDKKAREASTKGVIFRGKTTTEIIDGATTNPIVIDGEAYTAVNGDLVIYDKTQGESTIGLEFIFDGTKWNEFGSSGELGALAFKDSASGDITPSGTLSGGEVTVTPTTAKKYVAESANGGGAVTNGTAAECTLPTCTLPTLAMSVEDETLSLDWNAGSYTDGSFKANTPTAVTLPNFAEQDIVSDIEKAEITTEPTFTGDKATVTVE